MKLKDVLKGLAGRVSAVFNKFNNYASFLAYQSEANSALIQTIGINTYANNKVGPVLNIVGEFGGVEFDAVDKWIVNNSGVTKKMLFDAVATVSDPGDNNTRIHFAIFKNSGATPEEQTVSFTKLESTTGASVLNAASAITMEPGDYIEVFCKTDKNNGSFYVDHMQLRLIECPRLDCGPVI